MFKDQIYVSYVTDKNLKDIKPLKQFSQAQYILAPTILDPENLTHPFVIVDCSTEEAASRKIKQLNLRPIKKNAFGIIIAQHT